MHCWGDDFKYFEDVGAAAYEIGDFCKRWARLSVTTTKEKFGTARVYCHFGINQFHCIFWPGHVYNRYPFGQRYLKKNRWKITKLWLKFEKWLGKIMWKIDCRIGSRIMRYSRFNNIATKWQINIYRLAYKRALKKYPHIREEILNGADYNELLKGL